MKKLGILFVLFFALNSFAQTENNPAVFSTSVEKVSEDTYDLIFTVKILRPMAFVFSIQSRRCFAAHGNFGC